MSRDRYTPKMIRLMTAARHPLVRDGRGWRAERHPSVRNRFNSGQVTVTVSAMFSGDAVNKLLAGGLLTIAGESHAQRLRLTPIGKTELKALPAMCIKCGCTEDRACAGGCSWVTADVCSACAVAP